MIFVFLSEQQFEAHVMQEFHRNNSSAELTRERRRESFNLNTTKYFNLPEDYSPAEVAHCGCDDPAHHGEPEEDYFITQPNITPVNPTEVVASIRRLSSSPVRIPNSNLTAPARHSFNWQGREITVFEFSKTETAHQDAQRALMQSTKFPYWDSNFNSREGTITARREILPNIEAALIDLYNIRFPLHEYGMYNDRRGNPSSTTTGHPNGIAIDINWTLNPYTTSKAVWDNWNLQPNRDEHGDFTGKVTQEVIDIFTRHGFTWGIWPTAWDMMHFSADGY